LALAVAGPSRALPQDGDGERCKNEPAQYPAGQLPSVTCWSDTFQVPGAT
jgi:hypothetical protein